MMLGISDYIHSGAFYDEVNRFDSDLAFYRARCAEAQGPVLELCCGTGRLTVPLAADGVDIEGLDASESMLARAREKAQAKGVDIRWHQADMRDFSLDRRFGLVCAPFNSLQCLYTLDDVEAVFAACRHHLTPGGRFVFDVFNPDFHVIHEREQGWTEVKRFTSRAGLPVVISERCRYDAALQVNRATWWIQEGDRFREEQLDMRCFYPQELQALVRLFGFRTVAVYGDFDGSPFVSASPKQILVCEPA